MNATWGKEGAPSFSDRLWQGPDALYSLDLLWLGLGILAALEFLNYASHHFGDWLHLSRIPVRGKHLDEFSMRDHVFIGFSKLSLPPFVYFYFRYAFYCDAVPWSPSDLSLVNTLPALVFLFVVYDFFYTILHWFLHIKGVYSSIHKHHHCQKAPSRANVDAINVHPVEFFLGEYNHLWALYLTTHVVGWPVHISTAVLFLGMGGFVAGLNHTRHSVFLRLGGWTLFDSKAHDVHHRIPQSNYGQYTMLWDYIFGSYRYDTTRRQSNSLDVYFVFWNHGRAFLTLSFFCLRVSLLGQSLQSRRRGQSTSTAGSQNWQVLVVQKGRIKMDHLQMFHSMHAE
jgi:sterol desaturase/sphingolipid hydroxylase (fatty acid hydroxylase superfamily)